MSWETHEAAKKIADGWYSELEETRKRNAVLGRENAKLREAVATAIRVQAALCGNSDSPYCRNECPLHRPESNDCLACDVIEVAQELRVEVVE